MGVFVGRGGIQVPVGVGVRVGTVYCRDPYGKQLHPHAVAVAIAASSDMIPLAQPASRATAANSPTTVGIIGSDRTRTLIGGLVSGEPATRLPEVPV